MRDFLKKLWYIFRQRYGQILLILLLLLVCFVSFRNGKFLLSNDNYSPELNPILSISRYIESPAWRGYRVLGIPSDSEQADIFRSIFFLVVNGFFPKSSLAQIFSLMCIVVGTLSMATLTTRFIRDFVNTRSSGYVFFISGLIYLSSLWTAWVFNFNMMPYIAQYGFLPLLLLSIYQLMKDFTYPRFFFLFISSILFVSTSVIGTLFFVNIVLILFVFIYFGWLHRVKVRGILKYLFLFLVVQLFWLLPFTIYTKSVSQDIVDSPTNRAITANTIDLEKQMMDLPNSARLYTRLLGTVDTSDPKTYIFPMSEDFMNYDFYKVVGLLPIFLALVGLVLSIFKKEFKILPLWIVLLGLLFLLKNQNPPLGNIYIWLQENFNIFKQVFRWVSSKLGQQYLVFLTITSTIGFLLLLNFLSSFFKKVPRYIFVLFSLALITMPMLFYMEYVFRGDLFTERATVSFPDEYYELANEIRDDPYSRIYYAPPSNNGYFREYDWGFIGSQFISYILPNPVMDMSLAIGSDVGEKAMNEIANVYDSKNPEMLVDVLEKYDVTYLLLDRSLVKGRYGYELDFSLFDNELPGLDLVWKKNFLELYKLEREETKYVETLESENRTSHGTFEREVQKNPEISLVDLNLSGLELVNGSLIRKLKYSGNPTTLYLSTPVSDIEKSPIYIRRYEDRIKVSPALPTLNYQKNNSFKEFQVIEDASVYVVNGFVVERKIIDEGIFLDVKYKDVQDLGFVKKNNFRNINLTDTLALSEPGDCSGGQYVVSPEIQKEPLASGFKIEGLTELPCVYTDPRLDRNSQYIISISVNWESNAESIFGFCFNSEKQGGCINREKYFYTSSGFGQKEITLPKVIEPGDNLSLTLYIQNPLGKKVSAIVKNVSLNISPVIESMLSSAEQVDSNDKMLSLDGTEKETLLQLPVIYGDDSYIYSSRFSTDSIWRVSDAEDGLLLFRPSFDRGMRQLVQNQMINQYDTAFETDSNNKYILYWQGENIKNIPSSLCLTYQGSDRCWIEDTFFANKLKPISRVFLPSYDNTKKLDMSFNSISFSNESENVLRNLVLMKIPESWEKFSYSPSVVDKYSEVELVPVGRHMVGYRLDTEQEVERNTIVSIPQAKSKYWLAVGFGDEGLKIFNKEQSVHLDGWKQGWDTENVPYSSIFVFYWPNILSYLGYILITFLFMYFLINLFRGNKYAR